MATTPVANESNRAIAKALDVFGGAIVIGTVSAAIFLFLQNGALPFRALVASGILVVSGTFILFCGLFWERIAPTIGPALTARLARVATSPISYGLVIFALWGYLATISVISGLERNSEIAGLRNDDQSIAKVIDRLVLPRRLTERQQSVMSGFLRQFEPHEFAFRLGPGEEIGQYRIDIEQALIKGGWTRAAKDPYVYANDVQEGVRITLIQTPESMQKQTDFKNPNALLILQEVFGLAGVRINGTGGGGGINVTEDRLTIEIGPARRDSYVFTAPDF